MKPDFERLPKNVTPSHYALQLQPDLINFTFAGSSKTEIKVSRRHTICKSSASHRKMKTSVGLKIIMSIKKTHSDLRFADVIAKKSHEF